MRDKNILIVGAGPAGIYAADKLAKTACKVVLLNRDIKHGGLAEFGIYPNKYKMKRGLRKVFHKILSNPAITYMGNVRVGEGADLSLAELRGLGFDAVVVAVGAQGTKWLGLPNEKAPGVYHAKDIVYHYNSLPPYSEEEFPVGNHVCVVGIGNVSMDIVHWLAFEKKTERVTIVARRGPAERAYTDKEMKIVSGTLDLEAIRSEFELITPALEAVDQSPHTLYEEIVRQHEAPLESETDTKLDIRFLRSPTQVELVDGQVVGLRCDVTRLVAGETRVGVEATGEQEVLECDTVVFAIGDAIEKSVGLPVEPEWGTTFAVCKEPWNTHRDRPRYMVFDPDKATPMWGVFVVGWARKASDGLVGKARADAVQGCDEVLAYLHGDMKSAPQGEAEMTGILAKLHNLLETRDVQFVSHEDVKRLEAREAEVALERGLPEYKYSSQAEMLQIIQGS